MRVEPLRFEAAPGATVSALLALPAATRALYVFAHGAGAGMRNAFMDSIATRMAAHAVATFRYQFPYMESGSRRPDPQPLLLSTVRAAVRAAIDVAPGIPVFGGGKSMGGRMTSNAAAEAPIEGLRGIAFLGFPLHPPDRPGTDRAVHLEHTTVPLLFVQGTRDRLADLDLLRPVVQRLGSRATLHMIDDADHSFTVRKRVTGRSNDDVLDEIAVVTAEWMLRAAG